MMTRYIPVSVTEKPAIDGFCKVDEKDGGVLDQLNVTLGESVTEVSNKVLAAPRHNGELLDAQTVGLCLMVTFVIEVSGKPPETVLITE